MSLSHAIARSFYFPLSFFLLLLSSHTAIASEGDRVPIFYNCVRACSDDGCVRAGAWNGTCNTACPLAASPAPWYLRLTRWDCLDDCHYQCMRLIEQLKAAHPPGQVKGLGRSKHAVVKYFGKWPFTRVLGVQEICSVLLSLGNLAAHVVCMCTLLPRLLGRSQGRNAAPTHPSGPAWQDGNTISTSNISNGITSNGIMSTSPSTISASSSGGAPADAGKYAYPYAWVWIGYGLVSMNSWLMSSVFHSRDTWLTERLDYCSVDVTVAFSLIAVFTRSLGTKRQLSAFVASMLVVAGLMYHLHYMLFIKFDYGLNVQICIVLGLAQAVLWVTWSQLTRHPHRFQLLRFLLLLHAAMLLEILDFPPIFKLLDAHAAWHATTIPLTFMFYKFVHADIDWVTGHEIMVKQL
eukprot:gene32237-16802_t